MACLTHNTSCTTPQIIRRTSGTVVGLSGVGLSTYELYLITQSNQPIENQIIRFKVTTCSLGASISLTVNSLFPNGIKPIRETIGNWSLETFLALTLLYLNIVPFNPQSQIPMDGIFYGFAGERIISDLASITTHSLQEAELSPLLESEDSLPFLTTATKVKLVISFAVGSGVMLIPYFTQEYEAVYGIGTFILGSGVLGKLIEKGHHYILIKVEKKQGTTTDIYDSSSHNCTYTLIKVIPKIFKAFSGMVISGSFAGFMLIPSSVHPLIRSLSLIPASMVYGATRSSEKRKTDARFRQSHLEKPQSRSCVRSLTKRYWNRVEWTKKDRIAFCFKGTLFVSSVTLFGLGFSNVSELSNDERGSIAWGAFTFGLPVTYFIAKETHARYLEYPSFIMRRLFFECVQHPLFFTLFFIYSTNYFLIGDEALNDYGMGKLIYAYFNWFVYSFIFSSTRANREIEYPQDPGLTHIVAQTFLAQYLLQ